MIARCTCGPLRLVILSTAAYSCGTTWAASGVHEHGAAELFLSSAGKDVAITFNLPAHSAVGFETGRFLGRATSGGRTRAGCSDAAQ